MNKIMNNIDKNKEKEAKKNSKLEIIDKIILMYPVLKKEKKNIINSLFGNKKEEDSNEYILEKFNYKNSNFFRDKNGLIRNIDTDIVGVYEILNGEYNYLFFDEVNNLKILEKLKLH